MRSSRPRPRPEPPHAHQAPISVSSSSQWPELWPMAASGHATRAMPRFTTPRPPFLPAVMQPGPPQSYPEFQQHALNGHAGLMHHWVPWYGPPIVAETPGIVMKHYNGGSNVGVHNENLKANVTKKRRNSPKRLAETHRTPKRRRPGDYKCIVDAEFLPTSESMTWTTSPTGLNLGPSKTKAIPETTIRERKPETTINPTLPSKAKKSSYSVSRKGQEMNKVKREITKTVNSRNAEACRKQREKRKEAENELRKANQELEESRELYLRRIADLQFEVDVLSLGCPMDLVQQNKLLRKEIRIYKAVLGDIKNAVVDHPGILVEESVRCCKGIIESSQTQVLGMACTSRTWPHLCTISSLNGMPMRISAELLPKHVAHNEVQRVNLRYEVLNVQAEASDLHVLLQKYWLNEVLAHTIDSTRGASHVQNGDKIPNREKPPQTNEARKMPITWRYEELDADAILGREVRSVLVTDNLRLFEIQEHHRGVANGNSPIMTSSKKLRFQPDVLSCQSTNSFANARKTHEPAQILSSEESSFIYSSMSCAAELKKINIPMKNTLVSKFIHGHITIPAPSLKGSPRSHFVAVFSLPAGEFAIMRSLRDMINPDGSVTEPYKHIFHAHLDFVANQVPRLSKK